MPVPPPYPANLLLRDRPCLVVGGGGVALGKVRGLLEAQATVHVVAIDVVPELDALPAVTIERRSYRRGDVAGYCLVIAATGDRSVNQQVFEDAERAGVWVNAVDDPEHCSFTAPSRIRRGDLLITFSTAGHSPALAKWLRRRFEEEFGPEYETLLGVLAEARRDLVRDGVVVDVVNWQRALDSGMLELIREGRLVDARKRLRACLSLSSD